MNTRTLDIQTTGGILVWIGLLDLLVHLGLLLYDRRINR